MIIVQGLQKSFHRIPAVKDLSFEAHDGTITGLLGSNGAGKTTTLRMICGVLQPDAGSIHIDTSQPLSNPLTQQSRIGALLDHTGIYSRLTVRENLRYFGELRGMPEKQLDERVRTVLTTLGLDNVAGRRTAGFSQGERMKTALGRALLHSPRNLLLDEPTNGLDVPSVRSLRDVLRRQRDSGACIIFSSHVLEEVRVLCDNVVIVDRGTLISQGAPAEICAKTGATSLEDAFVALTSKHQHEEVAC